MCTLAAGRPVPDIDHTCTDKDEGEKGTDRDHAGEKLERDNACNHTRNHTSQYLRVDRGLKFGVDLFKPGWQEAVVRHGEKDARLGHQRDQHAGGEAGEGTEGNDTLRPRVSHSHECPRKRCIEVDTQIVLHASDYTCHSYIENSADEKGPNHADRHISLRIFCLFCSSRDAVKSDICKKYGGSPTKHSAWPFQVVEERIIINSIHLRCAQYDDKQHDDEVDSGHGDVELARLANADSEKNGEQDDDEHRRHVNVSQTRVSNFAHFSRIQAGVEMRGAVHVRYSDVVITTAEIGDSLIRAGQGRAKQLDSVQYFGILRTKRLKYGNEVARPPSRDGSGPDGVLQYEVEADQPGWKFADRQHRV
mmetsp:Transcript_29624/g.76536  ORF Transcript_29624/g.76536 Transcript_29624/m.76536 type:complete len:363 (-) Transcript_29624:448-1536(-)